MASDKIKLLTITFEDNDEVVSSLKKALSQNSVQKCKILSVEGKIRDFDINIFVGGAFTARHFNEEYKLTSIHGIFEEKGNLGYKGDLTVSLAGEGHKVLGGDLLSAKASRDVILKVEIIKLK